MTDDNDDGIEVAPCPECGSLATFWDPITREQMREGEDVEDAETGTCDDCGASFSLSETVIVHEDDLVDDDAEDGDRR
jgi:hypothetical protein